MLLIIMYMCTWSPMIISTQKKDERLKKQLMALLHSARKKINQSIPYLCIETILEYMHNTQPLSVDALSYISHKRASKSIVRSETGVIQSFFMTPKNDMIIMVNTAERYGWRSEADLYKSQPKKNLFDNTILETSENVRLKSCDITKDMQHMILNVCRFHNLREYVHLGYVYRQSKGRYQELSTFPSENDAKLWISHDAKTIFSALGKIYIWNDAVSTYIQEPSYSGKELLFQNDHLYVVKKNDSDMVMERKNTTWQEAHIDFGNKRVEKVVLHANNRLMAVVYADSNLSFFLKTDDGWQVIETPQDDGIFYTWLDHSWGCIWKDFHDNVFKIYMYDNGRWHKINDLLLVNFSMIKLMANNDRYIIGYDTSNQLIIYDRQINGTIETFFQDRDICHIAVSSDQNILYFNTRGAVYKKYLDITPKIGTLSCEKLALIQSLYKKKIKGKAISPEQVTSLPGYIQNIFMTESVQSQHQ